VQPRTPPRQVTRYVDGHGMVAAPGRHSDHSKQSDGQLSFPATDTRAHRSARAAVHSRISGRSLALDHGLVYRHHDNGLNHPPDLAAPWPGSDGPQCSCAAGW
jgi:hypothetical protein